MAETEKLNEQVLENIAGGGSGYIGAWVTVRGLQTGYLALRREPCYDYGNEIRGSESYNGQSLQITGSGVMGGDGKPYVWVYNPRSGMSGWVNANFLG